MTVSNQDVKKKSFIHKIFTTKEKEGSGLRISQEEEGYAGHEGEGYEVYAGCEHKGSFAEDPERILPLLIT